ncbi:MAG: HtaA domain-containing protein [Sporichthyaceae bacterium]
MSGNGPAVRAAHGPVSVLRRAARTTALVLGAVLVAGLLSAVAPAVRTAVPISAGNLLWGLDRTFRQWAGPGALTGGVGQDPSGAYVWPVAGGSYDEVARSTSLTFAGRVQWLADPDPVTGRPRLDLTLSNPEVRLAGDGSTLTMQVDRVDPGGPRSLGRLPIANLDIARQLPTSANGLTRWGGVRAELTGQAAAELFGGRFPAGRLLDPVDVSYPGPGGAPDLSEGFGQPGLARLERTADRPFPWVGNGASWLEPLLVDDRLGVVHARVDIPGTGVRIQSFETSTGRFGTSSTVPPVERFEFADPANRRVYFRSNPAAPIDSYLQWDQAANTWSTQALPVPLVVRGTVYRQMWDAERRRLYTFDREVPPNVAPDNFDAHVWFLNTYAENGPGGFVETRQVVPNGPPGRNRDWYGDLAAVASDGSILLRPNAAVHSALLRRVVPGVEALAVEVPGTEQPAPPDLVVGANGHVAMLLRARAPGPASVQTVRVVGGGAVQLLGGRLEFARADVQAASFDPVDGTLWLQVPADRRLLLVREGRILADQADPLLNDRAAFVWVGPDRTAHVLSSDGLAFRADGTDRYRYGFAAYRSTGVMPGFAAPIAPASPQISLARPDDVARVTFTVGAPTQPDTSLRWQVRRSGEARFSDVPGATAAGLTAEVRAGDHRSQFRAVFVNAAGSVATEPATLAVLSPPRIAFQPVSATTEAGRNANFAVVATGTPDPVVGWERLVDGQWRDLGPQAAASSGTGFGALGLAAVGPELNGTRYRARVANPVGVAFSEEVVLTVLGGGGGSSAVGGVAPGDQTMANGQLPPNSLFMPITAGEFVWAVDGDRLVDFQLAPDGAGFLQAVGLLDPVVVTDTRTGGASWSLSGQMSPFSGGLPAGYLGWTPQVIVPGAGAMPGPPIEAGRPDGEGLSPGALLAYSPGGHGPGTARLGATLVLRVPVSTAPGTYTSTLTITALG